MKRIPSVNLVLFIAGLALIASCSSSDDTSKENVEDQIENPFMGKVYLFKPAFDSVNCSNDIGCDCCATEIMFMNEKEFVTIGWCIWNDSYSKGFYEILDGKVRLNYGESYVMREYNEAYEVDTTGTVTIQYFVNKKQSKATQVELEMFTCQKEQWLRFEFKDQKEYGRESGRTLDELIQEMRDDEVWFELFP